MTFHPMVTWSISCSSTSFFAMAPLTPLVTTLYLNSATTHSVIYSQSELNMAILEAKANHPGMKIVYCIPSKDTAVGTYYFKDVTNPFHQEIKVSPLLDRFGRFVHQECLGVYLSVVDKYGRPI